MPVSTSTALTDLKLLRRAIRARWPIPANRRGPMVRKLLTIAENNPDDRLVLIAIRCLIEADKCNLTAEAQILNWLQKQPPEAEPQEDAPDREIVVRTREEAQAILALIEAGRLP